MAEDEWEAKQQTVISRVRKLLALGEDRRGEVESAIKRAFGQLGKGGANWDRAASSGKLKKPLQNFCAATKALENAMKQIVDEEGGDLILLQLDHGFRQVNFDVLFALGDALLPIAYDKPKPNKRSAWRKDAAAHAALQMLRELDLPTTTTKDGLFCRSAAQLYGLFGDPLDDLQHQCRNALKMEREKAQKIEREKAKLSGAFSRSE